jgi:hypothetical protein
MTLAERLAAAQASPVNPDADKWQMPPELATVENKLARLHGLEDTAATDLTPYTIEAESPSEPTVETADAELPVEENPTITATSRVGRLLQRISDRVENGAERADRTSELLTDAKEVAKTKIRGIGRAALELSVGATLLAGSAAARGVKRASEVSGDAMMSGFQKVEAGMDTVGGSLNTGAEKVKNTYQTVQFNRETKSNDRKFRKEYAKEVKAFDKNAERESKILAKQEKIDSKEAAREDKKFERSMRKKVAQERKDARRAKWAARRDGLKEYGGYVKEGFVETGAAVKDKLVDSKENAKRKARIYRSAGRQALVTYRDAVDAHK